MMNIPSEAQFVCQVIKRLIRASLFYSLVAGEVCLAENTTPGYQSGHGKPNIILFLVDDLGINDTSVPFCGKATLYNQRYQTPHLEELAKQSTLFTRAYSQAICVPSRASIMTGQNFTRHNIIGDYEVTRNQLLEFPAGKTLDPAKVKTLPQLLKDHGYHTIHCGKYHLTPSRLDGSFDEHPTPEEIGFDINIAGNHCGGPGSYQAKDHYASKNGKIKTRGLEAYAARNIHLTDALTQAAIKAIRENKQGKGKPFFLYMAHYAVHTPIQRHARFYHPIQGAHVQEANYASMIKGVDASLGSLRKALEEMNVAKNTVIIFYSDNGGRILYRRGVSLYEKNGHSYFNYPLRCGKASLYEGGNRVPALFYQPGKTIHTVRCKAPVIIEDLYPTVAELGQCELPKNQLDGQSLLALVHSPKSVDKTWRERPLFFQFPYRFDFGKKYTQEGVTSGASVIVYPWKLLYRYQTESLELYKLDKDLGESQNLVKVNPQKTKYLAGLLDRQLRKWHAARPQFRAGNNKKKRFVKYPMELLLP